MNDEERRALIQEYLDRLARELGDLPRATRDELVTDVRGHIDEAWGDSPDQSRAALLNILERLGPPESLAREARERLGLPARAERPPAGPLEIAAIALTALFWPVGLILAWLSPMWRTRDKIIATAIPIVGLVLVPIVSFAAYVTPATPAVAEVSTVVSVTEEETNEPAGDRLGPVAPAPTSRPANVVVEVLSRFVVIAGIVGAPFFAAGYLALTLGRRRAGLALLAATVVVLFAVAIVVIGLTPVSGGPSVAPRPASSVVVEPVSGGQPSP